ncbi:MAG: hypothetical protein Q9180_007513 [Flavoplaca navasiana]
MSNQGPSEKELMKEVTERQLANRHNRTARTQQELDEAVMRLQRFRAERQRPEVNKAKRESQLGKIRSTASWKALPPTSQPSKRELQLAKAQDDYDRAQEEAERAQWIATRSRQKLDRASSSKSWPRRELDNLDRDCRHALAEADHSDQLVRQARDRLDKAQRYLDVGRINAERRQQEAQAAIEQQTADQAALEDQASSNTAATDKQAADKHAADKAAADKAAADHEAREEDALREREEAAAAELKAQQEASNAAAQQHPLGPLDDGQDFMAMIEAAEKPTVLGNNEALDADEVSHAIAALVVGISNGGPNIGIASSTHSQLGRYERQEWPCLADPDIMVVPLILYPNAWCRTADAQGYLVLPEPDSDNTASDLMGHWITVVAVRGETSIRLIVANSLNGSSEWDNHSNIVKLARTVIRSSGWAGTLPFVGEDWLGVEDQSFGTLTCGIHAIINAWAIICGLQPAMV